MKTKETMKAEEQRIRELLINRESLKNLYTAYAFASVRISFFDFYSNKLLPFLLIPFVLFASMSHGNLLTGATILCGLFSLLLIKKLIREILLMSEENLRKRVFEESRIFYKTHYTEVNANMKGIYSETFRFIYASGITPVRNRLMKFDKNFGPLNKFFYVYLFIRSEKFSDFLLKFFDYSYFYNLSELNLKFKRMLFAVVEDKITNEEEN